MCLALAWYFGKSFTKRKYTIHLLLSYLLCFINRDDPYPGYTDRMAVAVAVKNGLRPTVDSSVPFEIKGNVLYHVVF